MSSPYGDAFLPATARSDLNYNLHCITSISTVEYFSFFTTKVFSKRLFLIWRSSAESLNKILRVFGTCVAMSRLLQSIIIHKLLTSQFSKLKTKISEFSIDEEKSHWDVKPSNSKRLLICIITFFLLFPTISNYELMFPRNYLRFPTVFSFRRGQREMYYSKTWNSNREENNNCRKKWGVNICFFRQH